MQPDNFDTLLAEGFPPLLDIGAGYDVSIRKLATLVCKVVSFQRDLTFGSSKPDGTFQKLVDILRMKKLGWQPSLSLKEGVRRVYEESMRSHRLA